MVYIELKCLSFRSVRIIRMIKYWIKLLGTTNCILKPCYLNFTKYCKAKRPCSNLAVFIYIQNCIALVNYGNTRNTLCSHKHFPMIKKRIIDVCCQEFFTVIKNSPKCYIFSHITNTFCMQSLLLKPIPQKFRRLGAKSFILSEIKSYVTCRKLKDLDGRRWPTSLRIEYSTLHLSLMSVSTTSDPDWPRSDGLQRDRETLNQKIWALIFTCLFNEQFVRKPLRSRMSTSSFINALRMFMALRGPSFNYDRIVGLVSQEQWLNWTSQKVDA